MQSPTLSRRLVAEFIGTTLLLTTIVGSGIMAERLAGGNVAIALLANTIAIGSALVFLIVMLGEISGAHMNPAVSVSAALLGDLAKRDGVAYSFVQVGPYSLCIARAEGGQRIILFGIAGSFTRTKHIGALIEGAP